ncbi:tripartite tricarboxylate transporter permease [uncultured Cohaesibacter sp.]|uniref:tripartite tricarboxylate transporter permease n=1 Tax=uncultured Cohaesibacter sp. TaxID=1002546 RepID=UPI0029C791CD|nr:tripartite tricarboxylate transporter permease [uncultured Cohaesibacter sp.]
MDFVSYLTPMFFALVTFGVVVGIIFGAIPGMTATMAVAVCLPMTYALDLSNGLALLLGLYVGGISGGLVPAILLNIPGTPSSITTTFDGYPMTQKGEGERALKTGITASLFGGLFSALILFLFAPTLADVAIKFSYIEKFLIILFALTVIASLCRNLLLGLFSGVLGIWFSLIGSYDVSFGGNGEYRLMTDFMEPYLESGFSLLPVLIGLFGLGTILQEAERGIREEVGKGKKLELNKGKPFSMAVFKGQIVNLLRSSSLGTFVGMLPGVGGSAASVLAYTQQKNFSKDPGQLGKGAPEGVIASESSNNGLTGGALIPLLSLGIPGDSTTAVLIGAFTLQGIQLGPLFIGNNLGDLGH